MLETFFQIFAFTVLIILIGWLLRFLFHQQAHQDPAVCLKQLSINQTMRVIESYMKVEKYCIENRFKLSTGSMLYVFLLHMEEFEIIADLSEEEYDAFLNYLKYFYFDSVKHKVRKIKSGDEYKYDLVAVSDDDSK